MVFSERKLVHYTEGDCWALAVAVNELTGLPMRGVGFYADHGEDPETRQWCHVVIEVEEDTILDIRGLRSVDDVLDEFTKFGGELYPIARKNLQDSIDDASAFGFFFCESWDTVRQDAEKLVSTYLPGAVAA